MTTREARVRRDADGQPYWTFVLSDRMLREKCRVAFPDQLAKSLGIVPGQSALVEVEFSAGRSTARIERRVTPSATLVDDLSAPLRTLEARNGQLVRILVTETRAVRLRSEPSVQRSVEHKNSSSREIRSTGSASFVPDRGRASPSSTFSDNEQKTNRSSQSASTRLLALIERFLRDAPSEHRLILASRTYSQTPETLRQLAGSLGRSEQRVHDLEREAKASLLQYVGRLVEPIASSILGLHTEIVSEPEIISAVRSELGEFETDVSNIAKALTIGEIKYRLLSYYRISDTYISRDAQNIICHVGELAEQESDDFGLVDEDALMEVLPSSEWQEYWDRIVDLCKIERVCGQLVSRRTQASLVAAALRSIGRPATASELEEELKDYIGDSMLRMAPVLSRTKGIERATKTTWGFKEWIDDVYEGIPAEIVQRIVEDGGSTRLDRLLDEIPRQFGVSRGSVRTCLSAPGFDIEHGWVSIARKPDVLLGRLDDAIDGHDEQGNPYWLFVMEDRYRSGHSIRRVPPEVAVALGCNFGERTTVPVRVPAENPDVSVIWRKAAIQGPEIGRASAALEAIGAEPGDSIRVVLNRDRSVSFSTHTARHQYSRHQKSLQSQGTAGAPSTSRLAGVKVGQSLRGQIETARHRKDA